MKPFPARPRQRGFTLTELTIVLIIVALLLGGLLVPLSAQIDLRDARDAQAQLADAREALYGFAVANGRLPCPADPTLAAGVAGAGLEDCASVATAAGNGVLPWATLGLPQLDPWGQRLSYHVTPDYIDALGSTTWTAACGAGPVPVPAAATFALCSTGSTTITDGAVPIATNVPAVLVSHGKNGLGGFDATGAQRAGAAGNELENADADNDFVAQTSATFDDHLAWLSNPILMSRMLAAGRLP